jgi:hypothetical protein
MLSAALVLAAGHAVSAQVVKWTQCVQTIDPAWHDVECALAVSKTRPEVAVLWMHGQQPPNDVFHSYVRYNVSLDGNAFVPGAAADLPGPESGRETTDPMAGSDNTGLWGGSLDGEGDGSRGFWVSRWDPTPAQLVDPVLVQFASGEGPDKPALAFGPALSPDTGERMHLIFSRGYAPDGDDQMHGLTSSSSPLGDVWPDPSTNFPVGPDTNGTVGQGVAPIVVQSSTLRSGPRMVVAYNPSFHTFYELPKATWDDGAGWSTPAGPDHFIDPGTGLPTLILGTPVSPAPGLIYQFPSIAHDPRSVVVINPDYTYYSADSVYLVFSGVVSGSDNIDLFIALSTDGGATFPQEHVLHVLDSDLGDASGVMQLRPAVTVDPDGGVDIVYLAVSPQGVEDTPPWRYQGKFLRITNFMHVEHEALPQTLVHLDLAPQYDLTGVVGFDFDQVGLGHYLSIDSRDCGIYAGFPSRHENTSDSSRPVSMYVSRIQYCGPDLTCYANCDASTTTPLLNVNDFTCFLQAYAIGEPYANCDGSTTQPELNVQDFTCFLQKFGMGCSP